MLTILVFEIKEGKNAQKKIILAITYHYLVVKKRNNLNRFC
jgi:SHS2 domain-containing protein